MSAHTVTIDTIRSLADQLEADAEALRAIERLAEKGELTTSQAAEQIRNLGIAII